MSSFQPCQDVRALWVMDQLPESRSAARFGLLTGGSSGGTAPPSDILAVSDEMGGSFASEGAGGCGVCCSLRTSQGRWGGAVVVTVILGAHKETRCSSDQSMRL